MIADSAFQLCRASLESLLRTWRPLGEVNDPGAALERSRSSCRLRTARMDSRDLVVRDRVIRDCVDGVSTSTLLRC